MARSTRQPFARLEALARGGSNGPLKRVVALFADVGGRPGELEPEIWKLASC